MDRQLSTVPEREPCSLRTLKTVYNNIWRSLLQNIFLTIFTIFGPVFQDGPILKDVGI
jgi:hypothetical protein